MLAELERPLSISSRDLAWKNLKRRARVPAVVVLAVAALSLLGFPYLLLDSRVYQYTSQLCSYSDEKQQLERRNNELRHEIATFESIARLQADAIRLGFEVPEQIEVVSVGYPAPPPRNPSLVEQIGAHASSFSGDVAARWGTLRAWQNRVFSQVQQWLDAPNP